MQFCGQNSMFLHQEQGENIFLTSSAPRWFETPRARQARPRAAKATRKAQSAWYGEMRGELSDVTACVMPLMPDTESRETSLSDISRPLG